MPKKMRGGKRALTGLSKNRHEELSRGSNQSGETVESLTFSRGTRNQKTRSWPALGIFPKQRPDIRQRTTGNLSSETMALGLRTWPAIKRVSVWVA